ncbi:MAG TPA: type I methionyl aminopeptidase [bacterium]|nr:type I methionyl aminopeptidase [bacterium]HOL96245.1 type I methionyl aminopeptidase [bacterium]HPP02486.1 type I methionyl aminopeptidase [bacterium]HXK92660.1 type I methionyl aminopeptidase [bacterium]
MITLKSPQEIQRLQESADLVSEVQNRMHAIAEPGLPTLELDRLAESLIRGYGAEPVFKGYRGFPYTVCVSINEQVVHGFPSSRVLREGDVLSLDVGVRYQGYVGDCARTIPIGEVSPEAGLLIRRAYLALQEACRAVQAGKRLGDVCHTVETIAHHYGYGVVRDFVGHGVGREMHEDPQVPNYGIPGTGPRLKHGLVICIEPMFNLGTHEVEVLSDRWTVVTKDRRLSVHVEDMVALLPEGPKVLTSAGGVQLPGPEEIEEVTRMLAQAQPKVRLRRS